MNPPTHAETLAGLQERRAVGQVKYQIRDLIMGVVYTPLQEKMQARLDEILLANHQLTGQPGMCISHRGRTWRHSLHPKTILPVLVPRPAKSLLDRMNAWHTEQLKIEEEKCLTGGAVTAVLNAVTFAPDYYKLFPECTHQVLQEFLAWNLFWPPVVCPLTDEQLDTLRTKQGPYIDLLKQRMLRNLITS